MFRRKIIVEHSLEYDKNLEPAEDYDLWVRMLPFGKIMNVPKVLLIYRIHASQVSTTRNELQQKNASKAREKLLGYLYNSSPSINVFNPIHFSYKDVKTNTAIFSKFEKEIENLICLNAEKKIFEMNLFQQYLNSLNKEVIRNYFYHSFTWHSLYLFLSSGKYFSLFSKKEKLRIIMKSVLNWSWTKKFKKDIYIAVPICNA